MACDPTDPSGPSDEGNPVPEPRLASPADAAEFARLRSANILGEALDEAWLTPCADQLAARLQAGGDARAYVVDSPPHGLATCALGLVHAVLPTPKYPKGLAVRIHAVATDPAHRRHGHARAAPAALLDHLEHDGVTLYELYASSGSAPLYEQLGFPASVEGSGS